MQRNTIESLQQNIDLLEALDLTPFSDRDKQEIEEEVDNIIALCHIYIIFAEVGQEPTL